METFCDKSNSMRAKAGEKQYVECERTVEFSFCSCVKTLMWILNQHYFPYPAFPTELLKILLYLAVWETYLPTSKINIQHFSNDPTEVLTDLVKLQEDHTKNLFYCYGIIIMLGCISSLCKTTTLLRTW